MQYLVRVNPKVCDGWALCHFFEENEKMMKKGVDETRMSWYLWRHTAFGAVAERLKAPVC
jgi:hypothetical protein